MSAIDLLFSVPTFLDLIEQYPSLTEPLPFTKLFMSGGVESVDGDRVIYDKITNDRRLGAVRGVEDQAYVAQAPNVKSINQGLLWTAEKEILSPSKLFLSAAPGSPLKSNAYDQVVRAVRRITARLLRTREYVCARLLQNSGGVTISNANTDFVAGANTIVNTVSIEGSLQTAAASASWATPTTKMLSAPPSVQQLPGIVQTLENNGFEAGRFIINRSVAAAVAGNLEAQTWLVNNGGITIDTIKQALQVNVSRQGQPGKRDPFAPHIYSGLGDIPQWHVWDHHFLNRSNAVQRYLANGVGVLLPEDLTDVLGFAEGPVFVPSNAQILGDANQAADLISVRKGISLYAYRTVDDTGNIVIVGRDSFIPMVRNELGVYTVTGLAA